MKSESDQFERRIKSRLSELEPDWPRNGFAVIRRQLLRRQRWRRRLRLAMFGLLILSATGLGWMYFDRLDQPNKVTAGHYSREISAPPGTSSSGADSQIAGFQRRSNSGDPRAAATDFQNELVSPPTASKTRATSAFLNTAVLPELEPLPGNRFLPAPLEGSGSRQIRAEDLAIRSISLLSGLPTIATSSIPGETETSFPPHSYTFTEPSILEKGRNLAWEGALAAGLSFFHIIPNRNDAVHFYELASPQNNYSLSASIAGLWRPAPRFFAGVQTQYAFIRADLILTSIEKSPGGSAIVQLRNRKQPLFYPNYEERSDVLTGQFHQLGVGAFFRYRLLTLGDKLIDAQLGGTYRRLLEGGGENLFPERSLSIDLSVGLSRPMTSNLRWTIRPIFSYGFTLGNAPKALRVNRMSFGVGVSLGNR